jgi:hypothetical protein
VTISPEATKEVKKETQPSQVAGKAPGKAPEEKTKKGSDQPKQVSKPSTSTPKIQNVGKMSDSFVHYYLALNAGASKQVEEKDIQQAPIKSSVFNPNNILYYLCLNLIE